MAKTKYLVGVFIATAFLIGGCSDETENHVQNTTQQNLSGQRLTDDNGVEYTLIDNGDGTETARYDDGRSVTFRRQNDGSLDFLSGTAGLIAGMAAGYYLFHGFSNTGNWDASRNRYTISEPLQRKDDKNTNVAGTAGKISSSTNSSTATNSNSKVNLSKESTSSTSAKSGFGSAGARGGSSSAAS